MKKFKLLFMFILTLMPTLVFAEETSSQDVMVLPFIFMEAFVTLHMTFFVLLPLSKLIAPTDYKKTFWKLFYIRIGILLFFDFFITPMIAIVDFVGVFVGFMLVLPIVSVIKGKSNKNIQYSTNQNSLNNNINNMNKGIILKCTKCGGVLQIDNKICPNCGEPFDGNNVSVTLAGDAVIQDPVVKTKVTVSYKDFDNIYTFSESEMVDAFVDKQLEKYGVDKNSNMLPSEVIKRKKILNMIFSLLVFIFISLIFFHFPIKTYILGLLILIVFFVLTRKFNLTKYLSKQIKSRPSEKISNIIMNMKETLQEDNSKKPFLISIVVAILLPLVIFYEPRILYEKIEGGYAVRFYTFGVTNYTTATIPETYKGEKVVSLRGNTFSNMFYLEKVELPDTITEIRGQAFKNDKALKEVNIPKKLEYLGGGAFYNCTSIESIELPDTVTFIGGEAFYGATSLTHVKLSKNISEIRGNTFEGCISLTSIEIPDKVTRIGGHAFYGCSSLNEVGISEDSSLVEIGSSAFRKCNSLQSITLKRGVSINQRAFKESPTTINYYEN